MIVDDDAVAIQYRLSPVTAAVLGGRGAVGAKSSWVTAMLRRARSSRIMSPCRTKKKESTKPNW
jgi:hypothetical protein